MKPISHEWIKERRREQNARAKQRSRARQKAQGQSPDEDAARVRVPQHISTTPGKTTKFNCCAGVETRSKTPLKFDDFLRCFPRKSDLESVAKILDAENVGISAIVKYGVISMGFSVEDDMVTDGSCVCFACWTSIMESRMEGRFDIGAALHAGVQTLSELIGPAQWVFETKRIPAAMLALTPLGQQPSISKTLTLTKIPIFSAFLAIATHIGIPAAELVDDNADSPFVTGHEYSPPLNLTTETTQSRITRLKPDLQPIQEQMVVRHHPYLDLIPFPSFRFRALSAIARKDPSFDEHQLCFDLMHGGMRCWGSSLTSSHGRGEGAPWDARSWEVAPWFFQKWTLLVGDEDDIVYKNSAWWWAHY